MTSTSEADRKRRHFSSLSSSPSEAAAVKKQPFFWPSSEDKLSRKLEAQQVDCSILEDRLTLIKEKQLPYSHSLKAVHKSWDKLTAAVESCSVRVSDSSSGANRFLNNEDVSSPHIKEDFIKRLLETAATENSSSSIYSSRMEVDNGNTSNQLTQTLYSLVAATNDLRCLKDRLYPTFLKMGIDKVGMCVQLSLNELESENKSFRVVLHDVLVKFKLVLRELQSHRDADAKVKADLKQIRGELENEVEELQQCNSDLSALRTEMDATAGAFFPVLNIGNKLANGDKDRDKQRDLQDTESVLKELRILASSRLQELKDLHEERTHILGKSSLLEKSKSVRCISSSQAYLSLKDQLANTKEAVFKYMDLLEKRQVEKDSIVWREREMNIKNELVDVSRRFSAVADSRIATLDLEVIFYEQDWNPQVDKQALQRAHRIGQISHVLSINLVTEHTVEEVILRRAERKLQLSHNVVGDVMEEKEEDHGNLRSLVFGLQRFDPEETSNEESNNLKMVELSSLAEKVIAIRRNVAPDKEARKFEMNSSDTLRGSSSSANVNSELDEASYLSWVEKLKEASGSSKDDVVMELGNRKNISEERHLRVEAARKKAEEKKLATWEAHGYRSMSVEEPIFPDYVESSSDAGSVNFVYGDCTHPSTVVSREPTIIFSCVDDSGNWGRGGMFDALSKLSSAVPDAYHRASEFKDLHLGDLHLIKIDGTQLFSEDDQQNADESKPLWVALAVTQSYKPRRKVARSSISIPDLERCLAKASFSASQKSASIHMPRIGYRDGSDRSQWYTVERLLGKYSSIFAVKIFVYYYRRSP